MEPIGGTAPRASESSTPGASPRPPGEEPIAGPDASLVKPLPRPHAKSSAKIPSLFQFLPEEFTDLLVHSGHERYRGRQILDWVYNKGTRDPLLMSNVSRHLRDSLGGLVGLDLPPVTDFRTSGDGDASKLAIQLDDLGLDYVNLRNDLIEAVTLEDVRRVSAELFRADELTFVVVGKPDGVASEAAGSGEGG